MPASLAGPAAGTPRALTRLCQRRPGPGEPPPADLYDLRGVICVPAACRPSRSLPLVSRSPALY